jgi:phosphoribosylamine--glycine ligase
MRLRSDLVALCLAAIDGGLDRATAVWDPRAALGVVLAAVGYPNAYAKGRAIQGLDAAARMPDCKVFHAGTQERDGEILTNGGRVLCVAALGETVAAAQARAYEAAAQIHWPDCYYRRDIGHRAVARERES